VELKLTVDLRFILEADAAGKYESTDVDYISFSMVNVGEAEATALRVGLRVGHAQAHPPVLSVARRLTDLLPLLCYFLSTKAG
jgi:hypothetical protein